MATVTKSIGTDSRDYSTMVLWEADLDNGVFYSAADDAVGECYNDSDFTDSVTVNNGIAVGLNSVHLTAAAGEQHDGTAGSGVRIVGARIDLDGNLGNDGQEVSFIEVDGDSSDNGNYVTLGGGAASAICIARSLILHNSSTAVQDQAGVFFAGNAVVNRAYNNIIYDLDYTCTSGSQRNMGISIGGTNTATVYNNTIYNIIHSNVSNPQDVFGINFGDEAGQIVKNNLVVDITTNGSGSAFCFDPSPPSTGTADHNLSSDTTATGTGSLVSKTAANQFVSIVGGSEDLHLKAGADAIDAGVDLGTTPPGVNIDINGVDREGTIWDIGAHAFAVTVTKSIGTDSRDYSTITLWEAALGGAAGSAGNDAVGEMYNDSVFAESPVINDATPDTVTLSVAAGERHDGTAGTGVRIVGTHLLQIDSTKPVIVEWLEVDVNGGSASGSTSGVIYFQGNGSGSVNNCIAHDNVGGGTSSLFMTRIGASVGVQYFLNCIGYANEANTGVAAQPVYGIRLSRAGSRKGQAINCTVANIKRTNGTATSDAYGIAAPEGDDANISVINCISMDTDSVNGSSGDFYPTSPVNLITNNNMSEDTTASGTGSLVSKVYEDQFVSVVEGAEDYHLKSGADAIDVGADLGTTPPGVNIDIDGRDRDAEGDIWDIGADEYVAPPFDILIPDPRWEMPSLLEPRRQPTGPVVIDYSNPLTKDLFEVVLPEAGYINSPISGPSEWGVTKSSYELSLSRYGKALDGSTNFMISTTKALNTNNDFTMLLFACSGNVTGTNVLQGINDFWIGTGTNNLFYNIDAVGKLVKASITANQDFMLVLTRNSSGVDSWFDGEKRTTNDGNPVEDDVIDLMDFSLGDFGWEGKVYTAIYWERELSEAEVLSMTNDPYQFLIPA